MDLSLVDLTRSIQSGRVTPTQSVDACFERIHLLNPTLNALVHLCEREAKKQAAFQTTALQRGEKLGPFAGVPFAVKDLEDAKGLPTSYGTTVYQTTNIATEDSPQVERLKLAGGIVVGKTNTPIFGSTMFCTNRAFGSTGNPWNPAKTSGGSSGGSAAAVAACMMPIATAADGGGSIRIPACFVGAFGMKPTFGTIPMTEGHQFRMLKFIDCVHFGPITRTVEDAAMFLDVVAGYHPLDPNSFPKSNVKFLTSCREEWNTSLRIRWSSDLGYVQKVEKQVLQQCHRVLSLFETLGHTVQKTGNVVLPDMGLSWSRSMGIQEHLMLANSQAEKKKEELEHWFHRAWPKIKEMKVERIGRVMREGFELNQALSDLFQTCDILATPCLPLDAFGKDGPMPVSIEGERLSNPMHVVGFMYPFNFSGHPAVVIRTGLSHDGLPLGIQLVAERHNDRLLLQLARQYERCANPFDHFPTPSEILQETAKL